MVRPEAEAKLIKSDHSATLQGTLEYNPIQVA